jgi:protein-disulfide isomerase
MNGRLPLAASLAALSALVVRARGALGGHGAAAARRRGERAQRRAEAGVGEARQWPHPVRQSGRMTNEPAVPSRLPAGATADGDGVVTGQGPVTIDAFIDFLCPYCRRFELSAGTALAGLVAEGQVSLVYHPMNFLDEASTTNYSTRAAAASGCAADQGRFIEYAHALFVSQPPEGGPGLTDAALAALGPDAGLDGAAFSACASGAPYLDWPAYVTARAVALGVEATPTVLVAGEQVRAEARAIAAAVASAARAR